MQYEMKQSGVEWIGEIPREWISCRLKRLAKRKTIQASSLDGYIGLENVQSGTGKLISGSSEQETPEGIALSIVKDDVIFGKLRPYLAKCYLVQKTGCCSTEFLVLEGLKIYSNYLKYSMLSPSFIDVVNMATYGTKMPRANWEIIGGMLMPVPPLAEQQSIASYLDEKCAAIDEIITEAKATIDEYKSWKASVIFEAVTKGLNPNAEMKDSGVEWIGRIPKGWVIGRIGKYAKFFNGDRGNNYPKPEDFIETGIPFLTAYNLEKEIVDTSIHCKYISQEKYESLGGAKLKINDIIFCLRGAGVGKCAINLTEQNGTVASSLMAIRAINITSKFLLYILKSNVSLAQTSLFMNGTCAENLSAESLASYTISVPPLSEQQSIVAYLDEKCAAIDGVIAEKEALIGELESYKKSLIFETVTGKRRVAI